MGTGYSGWWIRLCILVVLVTAFSEGANLQIYITPHSHDDVGWMHTITDYYDSVVCNIYGTITDALFTNPQRRFNVVEQAYFYRWYTGASDVQKEKWKIMVQRGQIEFLNGGWVMHDDAVSTYDANVNQMTEGHAFILKEFGVKPTVGWMIDPFGSSSLNAAHYALSGLQVNVINRIPYMQKYNRQKSGDLQFIWRGSKSLGASADILAHVLDAQGYTTMNGYAFDYGAPVVTPDNVQPLAEALVLDAQHRSSFFASAQKCNCFMWLYGGDFAFINATVNFDNMDKIVQYINAHSGTLKAEVKYSTASEYFQAVRSADMNWQVYTEDFFPYLTNLTFWENMNVQNAEQGDGYWTGFYTTRGQLKGDIRKRENSLRAADTLFAITRVNQRWDRKESFDRVNSMRQFEAECAHHDAVTGTSTVEVVNMYEQHLDLGAQRIQNITVEAMEMMARKPFSASMALPTLSDNTATLKSLLARGTTIPILLYNSLAWTVHQVYSVDVPEKNVFVQDEAMNIVPSQLNPNNNNGSQYPFTLFFTVELPPLGFSTYFVNSNISSPPPFMAKPRQEAQSIENDFFQLQFSPTTGLLSKILHKLSNTTISVEQNIMQYISQGDAPNIQASGAYVFAPIGPAQNLPSPYPKNTAVLGPLVQEMYQLWDSTHSQVIRLYTGTEPEVGGFIEISHNIGLLEGNREVITRFDTSIKSGTAFVTDANGLERRFRTYNSSIVFPIPGNYYPMVATAFISDDQWQMSWVSDRSHGFSSQTSGQAEIMLHRRLIQSDGLGPTNDDTTSLTDVKIYLTLDKPQISNRLRRKLSQLLQFPPVAVYGLTKDPSIWSMTVDVMQQALLKPLPDNLHLMTLKAWDADTSTVLLRLVHMYEVGEDADLSQPVTLDIQDYFKFPISFIQERSLTANSDKSEMKSWWTPSSKDSWKLEPFTTTQGTTFTIYPMGIKTFFVKFLPV